MAVAITTEEFKNNVKRDNPNIILDDVVYKTSRDKVDVKCKICNHKWTTTAGCLSGKGCTGCPACGISNRKPMQRITCEEWWARCSKRYNNKYTCDLSTYVNQTTPINIICPTHGSFTKTPLTHLHYSGCNECGKLSGGGGANTSESFITRCSKLHNNKYDYSKVVYTGSKYRVIVICPTHGDFNIVAARHLRGHGCTPCARLAYADKKKMTAGDVFAIKAAIVHNGIYDYTHSTYVDYKTPLTIICKKHSAFQQTPNAHLAGSGCAKCSTDKKLGNLKYTTEQIIEKFKEVHGDTYDYSKVNYCGNRNLVIIICATHGEFTQRADGHLSGYGCSKCSTNALLTTPEAVANIEREYPGVYDLDKVIYTGSRNKVTVGCKYHGYFEITYKRLMRDHGCSKCLDIVSGRTISSFISRANKVHMNYYTYQITSDSAASNYIDIICPKHGKFSQRRDTHLRGHGCPKCGNDALRLTQEEYITRVKELHPALILDEKTIYLRGDLPITVKCYKHGYFTKIAYDLIRPPTTRLTVQDCPMCAGSSGEIKLLNTLSKLGLTNIPEYKFLGSLYRYDFYIPELRVLVEYDGVQHYEAVDHYGGEASYIKRKRRDADKNELAIDRNMILIRIPYTKYSELERYFLHCLSKHYKYRYNKRYYENYLQLIKHERLPSDATVGDYDKYKTINIELPESPV